MDVTFYSGGCTLAGTFTQAAEPIAAALLITGSGRTNRDSDARLPGGRTLRIGVDRAAAEALAGVRVSTLRYDKRGVGSSNGDYLGTGMAERRADARAALGWLAARAEGLPLLAVGHSEGAFYAAELAADQAVAGAALVAIGARPGAEILSWQTEMIAARLPPQGRTILRVTRTDVVRTQRGWPGSRRPGPTSSGSRASGSTRAGSATSWPTTRARCWPASRCPCSRSPAARTSRYRPQTWRR